jgi:hypothetical protein
MKATMFQSVSIALGVLAFVGCADTGPDTTDEDLGYVSLNEIQSSTLRKDLVNLAVSTVKYIDVTKATADGFALLPGLDHCFNNQPTGAMGYHYINAAKLDNTVDKLKPEAVIYEKQADGSLELGAVEYIVPAAGWDAAHPGVLPKVLGMNMHLNSALGVYVQHVWLWSYNPRGMFEDWNSLVTCR